LKNRFAILVHGEKYDMVTGFYNGHEVYLMGMDWFYMDTGENIKSVSQRKCPNCGEYATKEGHDFCIANLPNVKNACCGHGNIDEAYIEFNNGKIVRGKKCKKFFKRKNNVSHKDK